MRIRLIDLWCCWPCILFKFNAFKFPYAIICLSKNDAVGSESVNEAIQKPLSWRMNRLKWFKVFVCTQNDQLWKIYHLHGKMHIFTSLEHNRLCVQLSPISCWQSRLFHLAFFFGLSHYRRFSPLFFLLSLSLVSFSSSRTQIRLVAQVHDSIWNVHMPCFFYAIFISKQRQKLWYFFVSASCNGIRSSEMCTMCTVHAMTESDCNMDTG